MRRIEVAPARLARWLDGFQSRHGGLSMAAQDGAVALAGADGATAVLVPPFPPFRHDPSAPYAGLVAHVTRPRTVGLLLVRRGGFGVGVGRSGRLLASKVGSRYVQGRTAAGGWSQQRYARRRANQTAALLDAATEAAERLLVPRIGELDAVAVGGDRRLVALTLERASLASLRPLLSGRVLDVADPRQRVLEAALDRASACLIELPDSQRITPGPALVD